MRLNPYLIFGGQCADAFRFYAGCLGGHLTMSTFGDAPGVTTMSPEARARIMHARLTIGDQMLMGSDDGRPDHPYEGVRQCAISITATDAAEAERMFAALAEGGTVTMPIAETFWAVRFGMLLDRFGVPWMVSFERPMAERSA